MTTEKRNRVAFDSNNAVLGVILFLLSFNFKNKFYILFLVFVAVYFLFHPNLKFTSKCGYRIALLFCFSAVYLFTISQTTTLSAAIIVVVMSLPIAYYIGYSINSYRKHDSWKTPVYIVITGVALHGVLNLLTNFTRLSAGARATIDFWTGEEVLMTTQIALFILIAGCSYYIFFTLKFDQSPFLKSFFIFLFICAVIFNTLGATRTVIYSIALNLLCCYIVTLFVYKKNLTQALRFIFLFIFFVGAVWIVWFFNIFNIRTLLESTPLFQRIMILDNLESNNMDLRGEQIIEALSQVFIHPWGGATMEFSEHWDFIHNMWLNVAYNAGLIPCVLLFIYCLSVLKDSWKLLKIGAKQEDSIFVLGMYVAILLYWMIEPVFEAVTFIVTLFCFINGVVQRRVENISIEEMNMQNC